MVAQATQQYREVKRRANVGETIRITENADVMGQSHHIGKTFVARFISTGGWVDTDGKWDDGSTLNLTDDEYVVLEPITETESFVDLIANLSAEVVRLSKRVETLETMWSPRDEAEDNPQPKQLTRDEIVAKAKADVEELALNDEHNETRCRRSGKQGPFYLLEDTYGTYAEFIINREKRTVVCLLRGYVGHGVLAKGIAKASPEDCYNTSLGKTIALHRALGLEIPEEYVKCLQPTEVQDGDVVLNWEGNRKLVGYGCGLLSVNYVKGCGYKVIDDSARYE